MGTTTCVISRDILSGIQSKVEQKNLIDLHKQPQIFIDLRKAQKMILFAALRIFPYSHLNFFQKTT
jgi:hypothetical protein